MDRGQSRGPGRGLQGREGLNHGARGNRSEFMTLLDLIDQNNLAASTPAAIVTALNAKTVPWTSQTPITASGLIVALGEPVAEAALQAFEAAMAGSAILRSQYPGLNTIGLDFS